MKENIESAVPMRQTQTKRNGKFPSALGLMVERDAMNKCVYSLLLCVFASTSDKMPSAFFY